MFRIYPYRAGSKSVRTLRDNLFGKIIKLRNSHYRPRDKHTVINWGNSRTPDWWGQGNTVYLNQPEAVAVAANKLKTFLELEWHNVPTVPWTTDWGEASDWDDKVFVRHVLNGHSGKGIEVFEADYALPSARLYTRGVQNHGEYRVHVFMGEVILYQKKSRRYVDEDVVDVPSQPESDVRNLASGWVYRTENLRRLERIEQLAIDAINAIGLDFGAVDIIKDRDGLVYVLEVNSAPGLGNTKTREAYVSAFQSLAT